MNGGTSEGHKAPRHFPAISIHSRNISFNAQFSKVAKLKNGMYVKVLPRMAEFKIIFEFTKDWQSNSYQLGSNGGSMRVDGPKSIQAQLIIRKNYWMKSVSKLPADQRWFRAEKAGKNRWSISVVPCFEDSWTIENPLPPASSGIYRFVDNEMIVSIGMGNIRNRIQDHRRDGWIFQKVEYSLIGNSDREKEFERFWQDRFFEEHGHHPKYNQIFGKRKKRPDK